MKKRSGGVRYQLTEQEKEWYNKGDCCPMCGLDKREWKRRIDWRCCSKDCTEKFSSKTTYWQDLRIKKRF